MSQLKGWWRRHGGGPCYTIGGGDWRRRCSKAKPGFEKPQKLRLSRSCLATRPLGVKLGKVQEL